MRWLLLLLLTAFPALAEPAITGNVLPDLSTFSTSGSTTSSAANGCTAGEFCTGNAAAGGGTYTSSFSVPLTTAEIRQGFTLNSAVTVDSHSSNAVLATCTSLTQASDCRDIFRLTISLFDGLDLAEKFEREIELDFGGLRSYTFADTVAANSFDILAGELSLFGIDAGYHSGFFGPQFLDPSLTYTYQTIVEQQILDQIAQTTEIVTASTAPPPPPPSTETAPPASQTAGPPPPATTTMETQAPEPPAPPAPPIIEPISTQASEQQQQEEAQATAEIEAEVEAAEQESQPEPESSTEVADADAAPEPSTEAAAPAREREQPARQTRRQKVKAAAQKVVRKIAASQRYSAASQTTMMIVMNLLSGKIATGPVIKDAAAATFFSAANVPDGPSMIDRMTHYLVFGKSNGLHNELVQSQWNR
jgi:outer membrane biosynthesis protein TonB